VAGDGDRHIVSVFIKAGTATVIQASVLGIATSRVNFNLATGAIDTGTSNTSALVGAGIIPFTDGWYRLWIAFDIALTSQAIVYWALTNNALTSTTRPSNVGTGLTFYVWGYQSEKAIAGAPILPTSYMPTAGDVTTRLADALTIALPAGTHSLTFTYLDDTTDTVSGVTGSYAVPIRSKYNIKSIVGASA
jgi:hypothetical protein